MFFKLIGAMLIFAACTYMGIRRSGELRGRCKSLKNLETALGYLETEISFSMNNLEQAFRNIDKNTDTKGLFSDAAGKIEKFGIKKAWAYAVMKNTMPMTDADRELLLMLGTKLGMTDCKNQIKHISYIRELLRAQTVSAENEYSRLGRIYSGGGVLAGIFIILIIV